MVKGAVFLALIVLATGCRHKDEPLKPLVIVDKPAKEDVQIFGEYVGRIRAARFVEIHARVEGYLEKMLFVEGKEVKQNEPLFIINSALYKAKVEKAKAQLKKNEAQAAKAKRDVERLQPLYEQHAASQLDLDNALASLGDAEADIAMSKADLDQLPLATHSGILSSYPSTAPYRYSFVSFKNAPLPLLTESTASVLCFSPGHFRRRDSRLVSCYALFECMAASEPTS